MKVNQALILLFFRDKWSDNDEAKILRTHRDFYHYILQSCISTFQTIILLSIPEFEKHKKRYIKIYHEIGE